MLLTGLHSQFLQEKEYLDNLSPKTLRFLRQSFDSVSRVIPEMKDETGNLKLAADDVTDALLKSYVIALRKSGIKPVSCNTYIRGVNCFLSWLFASGHIAEKMKVPKLKVERTIPKVVADDRLSRLIAFRGDTRSMRRVHAVVLTILDTGLRINEVITLEPYAVDLENLMLRVMGKGRKERIVPFSPELRRVLMRYLRSPEGQPTRNAEFFFCTREGGRLGYRNLNRDYNLMCEKIGIRRTGGFHQLRHTFATNFMRLGGNQFHLKSILGHAQLSTTDIYVHADSKSLRENQARFSPLMRRSI